MQAQGVQAALVARVGRDVVDARTLLYRVNAGDDQRPATLARWLNAVIEAADQMMGRHDQAARAWYTHHGRPSPPDGCPWRLAVREVTRPRQWQDDYRGRALARPMAWGICRTYGLYCVLLTAFPAVPVEVVSERAKHLRAVVAGDVDKRAVFPAELLGERPAHFAPHDGARLAPRPRTDRDQEQLAYVLAGLAARAHLDQPQEATP